MEERESLGSERIGKLLFRLALPMVVAQVINMLYNIVDRIYIGHMPGDGSLALTGVGVCLPVVMIFSAFATFSSSGGAPRASIAMGKGDMEEAERILGGAAAMQTVIAIFLTVFFSLLNRPILLLFGASENTIAYASSYMGIYALGTVSVQLTLGMNAFITAQGKTRISMCTVLLGAVSNIILDPVFIFVFGMGVRGAALATVISQSLSALWCIAFLTGKKAEVRLKWKYVAINKEIILPSIALGMSSFVMQSTESLINVCFNSSLLRYGGDRAVGAMTICSSVMQMAMLPILGIAQGAQPIISFNYGKRDAGRVAKSFRYLMVSCCTYSTLLWLLVELFPSFWAGIFTSDPLLKSYASSALRIFLFGVVIMGAQCSCQMTFVSMGKALSSIAVAVVRKLVLLLPLIYILPSFFSDKARAVFAAECTADYLAVCFTLTLFAVTFRREMKKLREE